jgi:hypothetical protein
MRRRLLGPGVAVLLAACSADDLHRFAGVPQGTLVVGLGMPMSEVARRSTVKLHKLPTLGLTSGSYADGNAYFDFELAGSSLRFHGCSMYSIDFEGPDETVTGINVHITASRHRWPALQRELRETAAKLKADGWEPWHRDGQPTLESFLARDASKIGTTSSGRIASFEWRKGGAVATLSADRAWDSAQFWSSLVVVEARRFALTHETERWPGEFPAYPGARFVCSQHVSGAGAGALHINWTLHATTDDPARVTAFYAGTGAAVPGRRGETLALASKDGLKHLSAHPVSGSYPSCQVKPPGDAKTVFVVSQGSRSH